MNSDFTSQMYMLMGLTQMGMNSNSSTSDTFGWIRTLGPMLIMFSPFMVKIFNLVYELIEDYIYPDTIEKSVSIKFPVHEIKVHKDPYKSESSTRQLYSINYLAINDYIRDNLDKIDGISNLIEILNVNMDYYSDDTDEKNFVLIPSDSSEIMIEPEAQIYCKIISTEKKNQENDDGNQTNGKKSQSNDKVKTYELVLFCKADKSNKEITDEEKRNKMIKLNKFIADCVKKYNDKNEEKYENTHWIYEYTHSIKDEYSGMEQRFREYLFENNKDLDTNIFFEGKDKLIKYVDKFIYNEEEVENKKPNKYEEEYKAIGYTYKATFLLYGAPGCGKTSTIKAILNRTKRHGIIINWSKIKTCEELETLFRKRTINHKEYDARELCYIIEDCDASKNNILLSRKNEDDDEDNKTDNSFNIISANNDDKKSNNGDGGDGDDDYDDKEVNDDSEDDIIEELQKQIELKKQSSSGKKKSKLASIEQILKKMGKSPSNNLDLTKYNDDAINLSCLLNILDGLIELHGVMVIFTTNHPEKLDEAFTRPGRIDFKQEFKRANIETIKSIVKSKFKYSEEDYEFPSSQFVDYVLSPAEIQSICFKCDTLTECIEELLEEQKKHMSRITNKKSVK
jgi:hypothetical protein